MSRQKGRRKYCIGACAVLHVDGGSIAKLGNLAFVLE